MYRGYRNEAEEERLAQATLVASMTLSAPNAGISPVGLGYQLLNREFYRSFDGLLDNIRIDGSPLDGSGAMKRLEAYRVGDVAGAGTRASSRDSQAGRLVPGAVETVGSDGSLGIAAGAGLAVAAGAGLAVAHYRRRRTQQAPQV